MSLSKHAATILAAFSFFFGCATAHKPAETVSSSMIQLGKKLFFDPRLSADGKISCASCHRPEKAFTNGQRVAAGVFGKTGDRNVPTLITRAGTKMQFWDGRAPSLEAQALIVLSSPHEMGSDPSAVAEKLASDKEYAAQFQTAFGHAPTPQAIARALAAFQRTLESGETPYDRFLAGDKTALDESQLRGLNLFNKKFGCVSCHSGPNFSDERLRPRCYPATNNLFQLTPIKIHSDRLVKTPTLRNLIYTAPYMHNGRLETLEEVVRFYTPSFQVKKDGLPAPELPVVHIEENELNDLVAFLKSLSAPKPYRETNRVLKKNSAENLVEVTGIEPAAF